MDGPRYSTAALLAAENTLPIAILSVAVIVGGYVAVLGLWWFMFRGPKRAARLDRSGGDAPAPPASRK